MHNNRVKGIRIHPIKKVQGEIQVPGDKSISHRAALFGGMAQGETHLTNFLPGQDCLSTLECLRKLGVEWERKDTEVWINGQGFEHWREPQDVLDVGNSGTTMRLILGVLSGCPFSVTLTGDSSIRSRPMGRVTMPLQEMGARILGRQDGKYAPLTIQGGSLLGIQFHSPVASAQVKSAILLAGLNAQGETTVTEPFLSRDHTERMLRGFGVPVISEGNTAKIKGGAKLLGQEVSIPGDISSAAFFLVLGSLVSQGELLIQNVGMNKTRTGILDALWQMGADIQVEDEREECGEPRANLRVRPAQLHGIEIQGAMIPRLIDEIPILAVAASLAKGVTMIRDAAELRVKETDRIAMVAQGMEALGADIQELHDGLQIKGISQLKGGRASSYGDHRLAMAWVVAGLLSKEGLSLEGMEAASVSFPNFLDLIERISN
ncbi:3-phosphoshikimate 1-carboxyvinyltransferase [Desulfitobacterium dichloroeliminans LMG P-21439]|uniref:3-phosphoshikimate 1-carboxyvinyltransferase n=1 Tax=Desulfitobacterium dichloroeliminans (strain LMG P-21439 / DCA1) TaxID=871963 RepID=L0FAT3_DESDL|nr:3-phosphoshikimate 1-carboxyvinyltransferase [Desulfitobacterium dichloroeliminans]AGA69771.1 3-phosphoshikimate 1-carboxyvinyltransferase [Desulfitobacterium dichloroeliminans LMG P-21439]